LKKRRSFRIYIYIYNIHPKEKIRPNKKHTSDISQRGEEREARKGRGVVVGKEGRRRKNLLNVISGDVVGVIGCHHGLHLHQVLLHFSQE
jgi:hypothetical protein